MFRSSAPVTASGFRDRTSEIARVLSSFEALQAGAPRWLALVGPRKVGKTSLLLEAARRAPQALSVAVVDVFERAPLDLDVFRLFAARCIDALLDEEMGGSLSRRLHAPAEVRALLHRAPSLRTLDPGLRTDLDRLADDEATGDTVRRWLELPEELCIALDRTLVLAIDEVQELMGLTRYFEPFALMRSVWQRHQRVGYVISGSAPSVLRELVTSRHSPFFQHFHLFELGPFERVDAVELLVEASPPDRRIPGALAERIVDIVGGHPFYLQMVGEALVSEPPPYDDATLKPVLQGLLFSRTGRLSLYFHNEYARLVGHAATLAATLQAIAQEGPVRVTDVARTIGASTASTVRYIERLGDAVQRDDDGRYRVADALFGTWVRWRSPGGTVVPMSIVGDEAEQRVARILAELGFDLVYQSRASRGAFDLLALRGPDQLGLQVERAPFPLRFGKREWNRMDADARRWGWHWVIAAVDAEGEVHVLDPAKARRGREIRLGPEAGIDNLLRWIDERRSAEWSG
ncbi:AAA family ATPase [Paraliomyxa miuraensis]|uniref:AAA family ATPase n=1 Tax=Paraliomyxa miuraensis TaxID=376150 RepID=UPI00225365FC|nr:AAA family ATPase [Paraliomyxa miuraensis]MCX4241788.1 AAA family ATPase [Paraliomyxa miuraensis]